MTPSSSFFRVSLGNGRTVDISTPAGSDAFLSEVPNTFLLQNLNGQVLELRSQLRSAQRNRNRQQLSMYIEGLKKSYVMYSCLADNASPKVFEDRISPDFQQALIDHAAGVFETVRTRDDRWKRAGVLGSHDEELLECFICFSKHEGFARRMLEKTSKFLVVLAELCETRSKPNIFGIPVAQTLLRMTNNLQLSLIETSGDAEKVFMRLEKTGILAQCFRAISIPHDDGDELEKVLRFLDFLSRCNRLISKKLSVTKATGEILRDVLEGNDGYMGPQPRNQEVMDRLRTVAEYSENMAYNDASPLNRLVRMKCCRYCDKAAHELSDNTKLLCCGRCQTTYYCIKDCQVADWKAHKKTCEKVISKSFLGESENKQHQIVAFVQKNMKAIKHMYSMKLVQLGGNIDKKELLLEIDFLHEIGGSGSSPAARNEFQVKVAKQCFEGRHPVDEPDWFHIGTEAYKTNVKPFRRSLEDHYNRMTDNHILCIARFTSGSSIYRIQFHKQV